MRTFILFYCLAINILALEKINIDNTQVSSHEKVLLDSISKYAIRIGTGSMSKAYIFVDPMCPHSKKLISKISNNKKIQERNSYFIFLYKLPKYESNTLSQYIYQAKHPAKALEKIMVENENISLETLKIDQKKQKMMQEIADVGKELNAQIRPYTIRFEKASTYCLVSSGVAPCMEEYDFEK